MKTFQLSENVVFDEAHAHAEPLHVDGHGRALRFALRPGQSVTEHKAPHSPVNIVVLAGNGIFTGGDKVEHRLGPASLIVISAGEEHAIRALDENLVFLVLLHGVHTG